MGKRIPATGGLTIGLDLSDKTMEACVLDGAGRSWRGSGCGRPSRPWNGPWRDSSPRG